MEGRAGWRERESGPALKSFNDCCRINEISFQAAPRHSETSGGGRARSHTYSRPPPDGRACGQHARRPIINFAALAHNLHISRLGNEQGRSPATIFRLGKTNLSFLIRFSIHLPHLFIFLFLLQHKSIIGGVAFYYIDHERSNAMFKNYETTLLVRKIILFKKNNNNSGCLAQQSCLCEKTWPASGKG